MKHTYFILIVFTLLFSNLPIAMAEFIDNGDGTISDLDVCLMWAKDANSANEHLDWVAAGQY